MHFTRLLIFTLVVGIFGAGLGATTVSATPVKASTAAGMLSATENVPPDDPHDPPLQFGQGQAPIVLQCLPGEQGDANHDGVCDAFFVKAGRPGMFLAFCQGLDYIDQCYEARGIKVLLYYAYFGRAPDNPGLAYWTFGPGSRLGDFTLSTQFYWSPEFTTQRGLSLPEFVRMMYLNFLGREPDPSGYNYWAGFLAAGVSRPEVVQGFVNFDEFRDIKAFAFENLVSYMMTDNGYDMSVLDTWGIVVNVEGHSCEYLAGNGLPCHVISNSEMPYRLDPFSNNPVPLPPGQTVPGESAAFGKMVIANPAKMTSEWFALVA